MEKRYYSPVLSQQEIDKIISELDPSGPMTKVGIDKICYYNNFDNDKVLLVSNLFNEEFEYVNDKLLDLKAHGINVCPTLGAFIPHANKLNKHKLLDVYGRKAFIIQQKANGIQLDNACGRTSVHDEIWLTTASNNSLEILAGATLPQYKKFINDMLTILNSGIEIDFKRKSNFFYDPNDGFTIIDLTNKKNPEENKFNNYTFIKQVFGLICYRPSAKRGTYEFEQSRESALMIAEKMANALLDCDKPFTKKEVGEGIDLLKSYGFDFYEKISMNKIINNAKTKQEPSEPAFI
ncbi:MAG: hypothetical protein LBN07_00265 [Christensenellaceae bacterium]|jgi:hypothetical protein|nr:hypothetical protein [Christensenellaceae bacterium]